MIGVTWKDGFSSQTIKIKVRRRLEGGFDVTRSGACLTREVVLEGWQADALEEVLQQMPHLDSSNDLENNLYDGAILEIETSESVDRTVIACSMKHRATFVDWFNRFELAIRNW